MTVARLARLRAAAGGLRGGPLVPHGRSARCAGRPSARISCATSPSAPSIAPGQTPTRPSPTGSVAILICRSPPPPRRATASIDRRRRSSSRRRVRDARRQSAAARRRPGAGCAAHRRWRSCRPIAGGNRSSSRRPCAACSRIARRRCGFCRTSAATRRRSAAISMAAGFDPRDVMDKADVATVGVPAIARARRSDLRRWIWTSGTRCLALARLRVS